MHEPIPIVRQAENDLIETARKAHQAAEVATDAAAIVIGQCVVEWLMQNPGSKLDDFANRTGISVKSLEQRRDVWKTFGDVIPNYEHLSWSHFREALRWDNAEECLTWANENQASKRQMLAWRNMQSGETEAEIVDEDDSGTDATPPAHDPAESKQPEHEVPFVSDPNKDRTKLAPESDDDADLKAARAMWRAARNMAVLSAATCELIADRIKEKVKSCGEVEIPGDSVLRIMIGED